MRTIIAGSRNCTDYKILLEAIKEFPFSITTVISGTASGVDKLGEVWARTKDLPIEQYPADWSKYYFVEVPEKHDGYLIGNGRPIFDQF